MAANEEPTVHRQIDVDHPSEDVWRLLTEPEGLARWMGHGSRIDPQPGGDVDVADVETGVRRRGRVQVVDPGRRLGLRWWPADGDERRDASDVELVLVPGALGTRVIVTERPVAPSVASLAAVGTATAGGIATPPWGWRLGALSLTSVGGAVLVG